MGADPRGILRHVEALSFPRPTGSPAEAEAARYVRERLGEAGVRHWEETFSAVADMNWFPISAASFSVLGGVLFRWAPWAGALVAALAPLLLWYALTRADSPLRFLLPRRRSRNVIARIPARRGREGAVALLAHLDTNRVREAWTAAGVTAIRWGTMGTLVAYGLEAILLLSGALTGIRAFHYGAAPLALYALATIAFLSVEFRNPHSPGANDDASAVAVALEFAARLIREPLERTEVWVCFTGAEEVDHRGAKELLRRHPELRGAWFVVLEGVGAGELTLVAREGVIFRYSPDPELLRWAEEAAAARPELGVGTGEMTIVCETQTLRRLGCRALTLAGRDPGTGTLPRWHSPDDLPRYISPENLSSALEYLGALCRSLDARGV